MRFRPTLWATLAVLPVLAVLVGLGVWQLQRLDWKAELIALRAERVVSPTLDLVPRSRVDRIIDPGRFDVRLPPETGLSVIEGDAAALEYRPIRLAGTFRHERAVHLVSRILNGRVGEHVITPLALAQGGVVLVDRGWVPPRAGADDARDYDRPEGRIVVEGHIRLFGERSRFTPDNAPQTDTWYWLDPAALAQRLDEEPVRAFYVQAAPAGADTPPIGSLPAIALRNPHLQYALTWFGVAGALVGVYVAFHTRRRG